MDATFHIVIFTGSTFVDAQHSMDVAILTCLASQSGRCLFFAMM